MTERPLNALFLCTGNSARSILGEAILNHDGAGRFRAFSAGSNPTGAVNPWAIHTLKTLGYPVDGYRSKNWHEFADGPEFDLIFTVCDSAAAETCPVWPGRPTSAHWGIPDPAAVEGSDAEKAAAFLDAFRMMKRRIDLLLALPLASLEELALRDRLQAIGREADAQ
ncbi:arsenate reductase ArsC [Altererythrobacter sp. H2]|uniref:arsenate reductase ArsC n=1 Tax=Altererythrobacter sp. H2 TaxID=3108391 RepID=UPI000BD1AE2A|nr:arsenate reductase ArsC [Altererythrobacter sp. H2]OZA93174.1 MAG: protein-tyrosine-phosphatase [Erythrobacter sp. 34-65-8]WRK96619.1 arsenate reductase ArsC [Altererythrobacter sp. H2]